MPYIAAHPLEFQTLQHWGAGHAGDVARRSDDDGRDPEIDGAIAPSVFGGRSDGSGAACTGCGRGCVFPANALSRAMVACPERAEALAARVAKLVTLRQTARADRKVAITLFNFPPNAGATGTAAFLAVFESLHATLTKLRSEGYAVKSPKPSPRCRPRSSAEMRNATGQTPTSTR